MVGNLEIVLESTTIDCDRIHITKLDGIEEISRPFEFHLEITVAGEPLDLDAAAGALVAIVFRRDGLELRRMHGMIAHMVDLLEVGPTIIYRLTITPRLSRLALIDMLDVMVDKDIPDLVNTKLSEVGLGESVEMRLRSKYEKRDFVVQYNETDLAFVDRLTEHWGISYFFDHNDTEERVVFTDHPEGFGRLLEHVPFRRRGEKMDLFSLELRRGLAPNVYVVQDYNYRVPLVDISGVFELESGYGGGSVDFGAHVKTPEDAVALAKIRAEERHAQTNHYVGASDLPMLTAGHYMTVDDHPRLPAGELLLVSVKHHATQQQFNSDVPSVYANEIVAVARAQGFRPARKTPKPRISGVVTGIIDPGLNPGSNDIARIDDQGRYYVRLLFDSSGIGQRHASHPIRMAQPHAGPGYGQHFPLKPGVEVIVVFVNGDPDRPIIAGAVPNPLNPSPVVAADAAVNRIRTQSGIVIELHDR